MRTVCTSEINMTESGEKNSILSGVEIKGTIRFAKDLTFDGSLDGDITSHGGTLIIGGNGKIRGNLRTNSVIVKGKVTGNITAESRCELHGGAELFGDLKTTRLVLEAGAMFVGRSEVNPSNIPIGQRHGTHAGASVTPVVSEQRVTSPAQG
jgi:cytoskeletal protein CcmA (bactofilin family)